MARKKASVFVLLILFFLCLTPRQGSCQVSRGLLFYSYIKKVRSLIQESFYRRVDEQALVRGAYAGMKKAVPALEIPADCSWSAFEGFYLEYSRRSPEAAGAAGEAALDGMVDSLKDPYSVLLTPGKRGILEGGDGSGIGVELGYREGRVVVIAPIVGSPAERAGLKSGDILLSINGQSTQGMSLYQASLLISGRRGESIPLAVARNSQKLAFSPVFETLRIDPIRYALLSGNMGYIKIGVFNGRILKEFQYALNFMKQQKVKGLILDLRNNPGGDLTEALQVAARFVPDGVLVWVVSKGGDAKPCRSGSHESFPAPVAVIINEGTASASEVLAAALSDNSKAVLVGRKSFGKGVIQTEYRLMGGARLNLTTESYLTPNKKDINNNGIVPNYHVKSTAQNIDPAKDPFVHAAWSHLRSGQK